MYIALLIPLLGTILGSAFVFFMKEKMSDHVQKSLLGFASGVMVAASVWSLLIPGMDMCEDWGKMKVMPAVVGFWEEWHSSCLSTELRRICILVTPSLKGHVAVCRARQCCHWL